MPMVAKLSGSGLILLTAKLKYRMWAIASCRPSRAPNLLLHRRQKQRHRQQ